MLKAKDLKSYERKGGHGIRIKITIRIKMGPLPPFGLHGFWRFWHF